MFNKVFLSVYKYLQDIFCAFRVLLFYFIITSIYIPLYILLVAVHLLGASYAIKYQFGKYTSLIFLFFLKYICGLKYKVNNLNKIPNRPVVIMSNHQSFWDNMFMQIMVSKNSWIIKKELFNIPIFGWGLKILEPVAIDRSATMSVKQILTMGKKKIDSGLSMVIFPEGTRLQLWQTRKFKPSGAKLALLAKVPIVLVAHNAGLFWPKGNFLIRPGTIIVDVISVIEYEDIKDKDVRDMTDEIEVIINTRKTALANSVY